MIETGHASSRGRETWDPEGDLPLAVAADGVGAQPIERHVPERTACLRMGNAAQPQILERAVVHAEKHATLAADLESELESAQKAHDPLVEAGPPGGRLKMRRRTVRHDRLLASGLAATGGRVRLT